MSNDQTVFDDAASKLASLYERPFGGKPAGRYRIAMKHMRELLSRRRLYEDDVRRLSRILLEKGFVLVDMDTYFVVINAHSFVNYRRTNEDCLK